MYNDKSVENEPEVEQLLASKPIDDNQIINVSVRFCKGYHFDVVSMKRKRGCIDCQNGKCRRT